MELTGTHFPGSMFGGQNFWAMTRMINPRTQVKSVLTSLWPQTLIPNQHETLANPFVGKLKEQGQDPMNSDPLLVLLETKRKTFTTNSEHICRVTSSCVTLHE